MNLYIKFLFIYRFYLALFFYILLISHFYLNLGSLELLTIGIKTLQRFQQLFIIIRRIVLQNLVRKTTSHRCDVLTQL